MQCKNNWNSLDSEWFKWIKWNPLHFCRPQTILTRPIKSEHQHPKKKKYISDYSASYMKFLCCSSKFVIYKSNEPFRSNVPVYFCMCQWMCRECGRALSSSGRTTIHRTHFSVYAFEMALANLNGFIVLTQFKHSGGLEPFGTMAIFYELCDAFFRNDLLNTIITCPTI